MTKESNLTNLVNMAGIGVCGDIPRNYSRQTKSMGLRDAMSCHEHHNNSSKDGQIKNKTADKPLCLYDSFCFAHRNRLAQQVRNEQSYCTTDQNSCQAFRYYSQALRRKR